MGKTKGDAFSELSDFFLRCGSTAPDFLSSQCSGDMCTGKDVVGCVSWYSTLMLCRHTQRSEDKGADAECDATEGKEDEKDDEEEEQVEQEDAVRWEGHC